MTQALDLSCGITYNTVIMAPRRFPAVQKPTMTVYCSVPVGSVTNTFVQDFADHITSELVYWQALPEWVRDRGDIDRWAAMGQRSHIADPDVMGLGRLVYYKYLSRNRLLCVWL